MSIPHLQTVPNPRDLDDPTTCVIHAVECSSHAAYMGCLALELSRAGGDPHWAASQAATWGARALRFIDRAQ